MIISETVKIDDKNYTRTVICPLSSRQVKYLKVSAKVEKISADLEYLAMMTDTDLEN